MIIPVNNTYRLASDEHAWMIQKARTSKGEQVWQSVKWFATFPACVNGLGQLMLRTSEAEGVAEAMKEVDRVCHRLSQAIPSDLGVKHDG